MVRLSLLLASSALLLTAGAAAAQSAQTRTANGMPTYHEAGLRWERSPSIRDMTRQYFRISRRTGGERGVVDVSCTPDARGALQCEVVEQTPADAGYGRAALYVMRQARVSAADGGSPAGRRFGYRLLFGDWPISSLPAHYHPTDAGLRWVRRPTLERWNMQGLDRGEIASVSFRCRARDIGSLNCDVTDSVNAGRGFLEAATRAMASARVQKTNGQAPTGISFDWTLAVESQSFCAGGANISGPGGADEASRSDDDLSGGAFIEGAANPFAGGTSSDLATFSARARPGCRRALVQLH